MTDKFDQALNEMETTLKPFMPQPYETDGQGKNALAQLHYFVGSYDAYIVEKDISDKQIQAFGWASFGYGFEAGYISIDELLELAELDLYFTPCPVCQVIREG